MAQNNPAIKHICCQKVSFFCLIPFSTKYNKSGSQRIVCHTVLNSIHTFAKLEKLNKTAVIIAAGVGSFWLVSDRRFRLLTTVFTVLLYLVLARAPFHIRYLVILMPVLAICFSLGLYRFKLLGKLSLLLIYIATTLYLIGYNVKVLQASRQNILETAVAAVKLPRTDFSGFIFSNYWPNILGYLAGTDRSSWLAKNKREVEAYYPAAEADSFTLLKKYGGYVFIEEKFSQEIGQPSARQEAIVVQLSGREPDNVISTTSPAFPYFREGGDRVLIYEYR